jgi:ribosomal protein L34E
VLALPAAFLWYRHRRRAIGPGRCPRCGYDLAGLAEGAGCPECGGGAAQ